MYNIVPAGAGGFKIRTEDGKGNVGAYESGIWPTEVAAREHIAELQNPKPKTAAQVKKEEADKEAADKEVADKAEADAAIEKEVATGDVEDNEAKAEDTVEEAPAEKPAKKAK